MMSSYALCALLAALPPVHQFPGLPQPLRETVQGVTARADFDRLLFLSEVQQQLRQVVNRFHHARVGEFLFGQRAHQPLDHVARGFNATLLRGVVTAAGEPVGAEAAIRVLQFEDVVVVVVDELGSAKELTVELFAQFDLTIDDIAEAGHAMRSTARGTHHILSEFLFDES